MEEPVARRLRSRDGSGAAASKNESRRAFGDASNRLGKNSVKDTKPKRSRSTRSTAAAAEPMPLAIAEGVANKRGRDAESKSTKADKPSSKPRRSSSRLRELSTTDDSKSDKPASKVQRGKKRISEDGETKTSTRSAKRSKVEEVSAKPTKSKAAVTTKVPRRSNRNSREPKSKPFVVKEVPIIEARLPQFTVPLDFGLKRDNSGGEDFTHGIAYYDAAKRDDPLLCKDYVTDMFQNMYEAETRTQPHPYMDGQDDINAKMRAILVDWLVEVHMKFRLNPNTLFLCVNITDRYCSEVAVKRSKLQLVGVTALLVACKHEEIYPPEVRDCVYICDRAYNHQEVLDMEQSILKVLNWKISVPTAYPFLHRFLSLVDASPRVGHAAQYYLERSLQEHDMLDYRPSEVCCAAVILAITNKDILLLDEDYDRTIKGVPKILLEYTGFDKNSLIDICEVLVGKVANESVTASKRRLTAVKKKFDSSKYLKVSSEVELPSIEVLNCDRSSIFGL